MHIDYASLVEQQRHFIDKVLFRDKLRCPLLLLSAKARISKKAYRKIRNEGGNGEKEFLCLAELSDNICRNGCYRFLNKVLHDFSDLVHRFKYGNNYQKIKKEMRKPGKHYLSIVCIVKNEAQYIS